MAYTPSVYTGNTPEAFQTYVQEELRRLALSLMETTALDLRPINAVPTRPREGMIVSADGIDWDPGSGPGAYEFIGGTWQKL